MLILIFGHGHHSLKSKLSSSTTLSWLSNLPASYTLTVTTSLQGLRISLANHKDYLCPRVWNYSIQDHQISCYFDFFFFFCIILMIKC